MENQSESILNQTNETNVDPWAQLALTNTDFIIVGSVFIFLISVFFIAYAVVLPVSLGVI
jgi:hypothetical protein